MNGRVAAKLMRRGVDPDDRVTITIEPDELIRLSGSACTCSRRSDYR